MLMKWTALMLMKWTAVVNFTNTREDPKSEKRHLSRQCPFAIFIYAQAKVASKMLVKLTTEIDFTNILLEKHW
jgi:hypothetical protein